MPCMLLSDLTYLYYLPQEAFVIIFSMYLDFNCACAKERCSPGSLRIALRTPASSLWLDITLLSKISSCSSPRSVAIATILWVVSRGVTILCGRGSKIRAYVGQCLMHTPQPIHFSSMTKARLSLPSPLISIASTGQTAAHFPQPTHLSAAARVIKFEQIV